MSKKYYYFTLLIILVFTFFTIISGIWNTKQNHLTILLRCRSNKNQGRLTITCQLPNGFFC